MTIDEILKCGGKYVFLTVNGRQVLARLTVPEPCDSAFLDFTECAGIAPRSLGRAKLTLEDLLTFQTSGLGAIFSEMNIEAPQLARGRESLGGQSKAADDDLTLWNPIASAPRDGTTVLVYGQDVETQRHYTIAEFQGGQWWPSERPVNYADTEPMLRQPTHWQPLEPNQQ
jgi:hypothetical protein